MSSEQKIDESALWSLPDSWVWTRMGMVADVVGGGTPKTTRPEFWTPAVVPWITPADLSSYSHRFISTGERSISRAGLANSAAKILPPGTVLFSSRAPIGYVAIAEIPVSTNQGFKSFVLTDGLVPEYVYYWLIANKQLAVDLSGGTTFQEISGNNAARIPFALAPEGEQRRIVESTDSYISRLDAAVAALDRVRANLKRYRASVLKAACEGRLVPTEVELARREGRDYEPADVLLQRILRERRARWEADELAKLRAKGKEPKDDRWKRKYKEAEAPDTSGLPELPEGWVWSSVDQLGEAVTGTTPSKKEPANYGGDLPFLKPTDLEAGYHVRDAREFLSPRGVTEARTLPPLSVLVTCIGATIGKTGLSRCESTTNQQINALIPAGSIPLPQYLFWFFVSPNGQEAVKGNASATTLPILNKTRFRELSIPLPPFAEIQRIVDAIESRLSLTENVEPVLVADLRRVERLRQSILQRAFEGKLVPQDPTDEPASVLLERIRAARAEKGNGRRRSRRKRSIQPILQEIDDGG